MGFQKKDIRSLFFRNFVRNFPREFRLKVEKQKKYLTENNSKLIVLTKKFFD
jgi:hypothetical protein